MLRVIRWKLKILARLIIKKYQPVVIGITGSMGKSSTKEAVAAVLSTKLAVRMSPKNYNNELGLPLTVIGAISPGSNWTGWGRVIWQAWKLILVTDKNYPHVLILEMGVDRPGDMAYLTKIVQPQVGVVTAVSYAHLEFFGSLAAIKKEKQGLIESLDNKGLAILNYDSPAAREMSEASKARVLTYGLQPGANLQAQDISLNLTKGEYELTGINFKLNYDGSVVPVFMPEVLSETALYAALAAAAVGIYFDFNLVEIAQALKNFRLPPGRMNVLPGLKHTFIIDDTYNSSPEAATAALQLLGRVKLAEPAVKYAVLGDMLELGSYSEEGHRSIGAQVVANGLTHLITVGAKSRDIVRGATAAGLADDFIFSFDRAEEVGKFLQSKLQAGDIVLVKGSQGMRLERVVKDLMAEPQRAGELLVRQGAEWRDK
jgi:UDP-N-acetylmuramoyl-tripeptide--D-alanyl-D-alanine ligase